MTRLELELWEFLITVSAGFLLLATSHVIHT